LNAGIRSEWYLFLFFSSHHIALGRPSPSITPQGDSTTQHHKASQQHHIGFQH
jgi:hypothetical protein